MGPVLDAVVDQLGNPACGWAGSRRDRCDCLCGPAADQAAVRRGGRHSQVAAMDSTSSALELSARCWLFAGWRRKTHRMPMVTASWKSMLRPPLQRRASLPASAAAATPASAPAGAREGEQALPHPWHACWLAPGFPAQRHEQPASTPVLEWRHLRQVQRHHLVGHAHAETQEHAACKGGNCRRSKCTANTAENTAGQQQWRQGRQRRSSLQFCSPSQTHTHPEPASTGAARPH